MRGRGIQGSQRGQRLPEGKDATLRAAGKLGESPMNGEERGTPGRRNMPGGRT